MCSDLNDWEAPSGPVRATAPHRGGISMQLCPDLRLPMLSGPNVALPLGRREHYRLALYKEIGQTRRSVLVVSLNLRFHFVQQ
jgi:hypothetical protein